MVNLNQTRISLKNILFKVRNVGMEKGVVSNIEILAAWMYATGVERLHRLLPNLRSNPSFLQTCK
jgi:hypothetical protein